MSRWRCKVCESFNDSDTSKCIVCEFEKDIGKDVQAPKEPEVILKKCDFTGCNSMVNENQRYCEYHSHTVCPICSAKLKSAGMDYCIDCGLAIVEKNTSGLRKWNLALKIIDVVMLIAFVILLLAYVFYFN
ncbi:MAG: hypothetical protein NC548_43140 [Lachnospiraceae bacterium]|nr:hypothetical protein [Lachnospiraceae bacterium]MCM1230901.1 hypothetical protein [Ruminococcus flavefaciens]